MAELDLEGIAHRIRAWRERRGLSQRACAELLGYSESWLRKIEQGERPADRLSVLAAIAQVLRVDLADLVNLPVGQRATPARSTPLAAQSGRPSDERQTVLSPSPVEFGDLPWPPRSGPGSVPPDAAVAAFVELARVCRRLDDTVGPAVLRAPVEQHLAAFRRLLAGTGRAIPDAAVAAAELHQLAAWLAFDSMDAPGARQHLRSALQASRAGGDRKLASYVLGWAALVEVQIDPPGGLGLARLARDRVGPAAPAPLAAWLARVEAEAHAHLGDGRGCAQALDDARRLAGRSDPEEAPPWLYFLTAAQIDAYEGLCQVHLRRPVMAVPALDRALAGLGPAYPRDRALYLTYLAAAHVQADQPEAACTAASESLALSIRSGSPRSAHRLRMLRAGMDRWARLPCVQDLDEQLLTV